MTSTARRCGCPPRPKNSRRACTRERFIGRPARVRCVPFNPSRVVATPVGTPTLSFASGDAGSFAYIVNGVSQTKPVTRQVFRAPGTICQ